MRCRCTGSWAGRAGRRAARRAPHRGTGSHRSERTRRRREARRCGSVAGDRRWPATRSPRCVCGGRMARGRERRALGRGLVVLVDYARGAGRAARRPPPGGNAPRRSPARRRGDPFSQVGRQDLTSDGRPRTGGPRAAVARGARADRRDDPGGAAGRRPGPASSSRRTAERDRAPRGGGPGAAVVARPAARPAQGWAGTTCSRSVGDWPTGIELASLRRLAARGG